MSSVSALVIHKGGHQSHF